MSGVFGLCNLNGHPVQDDDMHQMGHLLARRGPDGMGIWKNGTIGLGHTSLATTPEAQHENIPVSDPQSGCTITADVRIDNRTELLEQLGLSHQSSIIGDAGLVLHAYLKWDLDCVDYLLGDFAFAIWDPRTQRLFCARDHLGVRPFNYFKGGHLFVFASEPRAILVLPHVPYAINEERIADYLVTQLEGIDKTSTFFKDVYRLPPAHTLTVNANGMQIQRYWHLEPGPELELSSDEEYAEAFLEVFSEAVRCRLRGADTVGSMLSGGMDSGSVVAVAREILSHSGQEPLKTFSAVSSDSKDCVETQAIQSAIAMDGLDPYVISCGNLTELLPQLSDLERAVDEPFDGIMTLLYAVYLGAHRQGVKALMDGIDGDTLLSEGSYLAYLLKQGHWLKAYREAVGQNRFWKGAYPVRRELFRSARRAFTPHAVKTWYHSVFNSPPKQQDRNIRASLICPDFARRVNLADRLETLARQRSSKSMSGLSGECAHAMEHPYLTVGVERYNRAASSVAIEPRHPFLDRRLVNFCASLPGNQRLNNGWPKAILRRAMAGKLPDPIRWRRGKQHLGWSFTEALLEASQGQVGDHIADNKKLLENYLDMDRLRQYIQSYFDDKDSSSAEFVKEAIGLSVWLRRHATRPI